MSKIIRKTGRKINNILIVTHGGFIRENLIGHPVNNLQTIKQSLKFTNTYTLINKPKLFLIGVGRTKRNSNYYMNNENYGMPNNLYLDNLKECEFSNFN